MRPPTGEMMLVSSAWLTVWHRRFCVALCCTGLHRWLRGEILANLTIKAQRLGNKLTRAAVAWELIIKTLGFDCQIRQDLPPKQPMQHDVTRICKNRAMVQ